MTTISCDLQLRGHLLPTESQGTVKHEFHAQNTGFYLDYSSGTGRVARISCGKFDNTLKPSEILMNSNYFYTVTLSVTQNYTASLNKCTNILFPPNLNTQSFVIFRAIVAYFVPLFILAFCYTRIGFILYKSLSSLKKMKNVR